MLKIDRESALENRFDSWLPDAYEALLLTREWAKKVEASTDCKVYLFGSSIYKNGEQFIASHSDLDIVCLFPEKSDALRRHDILLELKKYKLELEVEMIPKLRRDSCAEPGVSIVALTQIELNINVHKSGVRRFWDKNYFYDFSQDKATIFVQAGTQYIPDERRHAMEYVQRVRNDFLSISANNTGGMKSYSGIDPIPKALLRSAAQLSPDVEDGEWYDTMFGLQLIRDRVWALRGKGPAFKNLADCVSIRSGARGHERSITPDQQILLAEILLDEAIKTGVEDAVIFQMHIKGSSFSENSARDIFLILKNFLPGIRLSGYRAGSIILQLTAPISSFEILNKLHNSNSLPVLLDVEEVSLVSGSFDENVNNAASSRSEILISKIKKWQSPVVDLSSMDVERLFLDFLYLATESDPELRGAEIRRDVRVDDIPRYILDFEIIWRTVGQSPERVGIEITATRNTSRIFDVLTKFRVLDRRMVLVLIGSQRLFNSIESDLNAYAKINANATVVTIPWQAVDGTLV